jgi:hypothetical protein
MSNQADEEYMADRHLEGVEPDEADWYDEHGAGHWSDETMAEFSNYMNDDPWADVDVLPGGHDFEPVDSEPPF